jgi:hypothetical protein
MLTAGQFPCPLRFARYCSNTFLNQHDKVGFRGCRDLCFASSSEPTLSDVDDVDDVDDDSVLSLMLDSLISDDV